MPTISHPIRGSKRWACFALPTLRRLRQNGLIEKWRNHQIREAAFFQILNSTQFGDHPQQIVALADSDADTFAEKAALDKGPTRRRSIA